MRLFVSIPTANVQPIPARFFLAARKLSTVGMKNIVIGAANAILLFLLWAVPSPSIAANRYVWCGAAGAGTGVDFINATTDLPASLVRGDTYYVAGSATCTYAVHTFNDAESGTSVITIKKANAADNSAVAGWQAAFATDQAIWTMADDPGIGALRTGIWHICRSYYTVEGGTGSGTSGYGFVIRSANNINGII